MKDSIPSQVTMTTVDSSQIKAVGFDPTASRLYIEFPSKKGRSVYTYENITAAQYAALVGEGKEGHSVGRYFGQFIKPKTAEHPFKRLDLGDDQ